MLKRAGAHEKNKPEQEIIDRKESYRSCGGRSQWRRRLSDRIRQRGARAFWLKLCRSAEGGTLQVAFASISW